MPVPYSSCRIPFLYACPPFLMPDSIRHLIRFRVKPGMRNKSAPNEGQKSAPNEGKALHTNIANSLST